MPKFKPEEKDKEIINKANIRGTIEDVSYFYNYEKYEKYAIVINKVTRLYAIRLIKYGKDGGNGLKILAVKRFPDLIGFYQTEEEVKNKVESIEANNDGEIYQCKYKFETHEEDMENNILIIGRTGNGKSALANVISNFNAFEVSNGTISKTKNFQIEDFEWEGTRYRVIDTVGFGDTNLSEKNVILKLAEAIHSMKRGIKQIFVVLGGKFTEEEIKLFEFAEKIFGKKIIKNTTIVRSKFDDFADPEKCDKDKKDLKNENKKIAGIINRCNGIIYVNNPPLRENEPRQQEDRERSREILLDHLETSCQESCELEHWDEICVGINDYMNAKKWKENEHTKYTKWKENEHTKNLLNDIKKEINDIKREIKELKEEILKEIKTRSNNPERKVDCLASVQSHMFDANFKLNINIKNYCVIT